MKKKLRILVILIAVLLVGTVGYYFMPKKFGKKHMLIFRFRN